MQSCKLCSIVHSRVESGLQSERVVDLILSPVNMSAGEQQSYIETTAPYFYYVCSAITSKQQ